MRYNWKKQTRLLHSMNFLLVLIPMGLSGLDLATFITYHSHVFSINTTYRSLDSKIYSHFLILDNTCFITHHSHVFSINTNKSLDRKIYSHFLILDNTCLIIISFSYK